MNIGNFFKNPIPPELEINEIKDHSVSGVYKNHVFDAKVYSEPSEFGINNGCVSKLSVLKQGLPRIKFGWVIERLLYNYDRGADVDNPIGAELAGVIDKIMGF